MTEQIILYILLFVAALATGYELGMRESRNKRIKDMEERHDAALRKHEKFSRHIEKRMGLNLDDE